MDIDKVISSLKEGKLPLQSELKKICSKAIEIFIEEPNVVPVSAPVTVCGDIHGQFYDLLKLFSIGGELPGTNYVFIGDFVDRGAHSVETMTLLICLKIKYPSHITLLRGNHESRSISCQYGFIVEIKRKYGNEIPWNYFVELFDYLPFAATIEDDILCVHGGISPDLKTLDDMRLIDRVVEIPNRGAYADLLWSDPDERVSNWQMNRRGAGYLYGAKPTREFNHTNGLSLIARAHQLVMEGYKFTFPEESVVTVWSAPNYTYQCGNKAAIMQVSETLERNFEIFEQSTESSIHPTTTDGFFPYFL